MKRHMDLWVPEHFDSCRQMLFVAGPRQVGKTTSSRATMQGSLYLNWDLDSDRAIILKGQDGILDRLAAGRSPAVVFDELHKYPEWRNFLKGLFDSAEQIQARIMVTGSARLGTYRKGADSLMGRYFLYHMHPLSIAEILEPRCLTTMVTHPQALPADAMKNLLTFGGFPEPFQAANQRFRTRWGNARRRILFREELRDLSNVHEVGQVEVLAELLRQQTGQLCSYAALARKVRAAENSIRRWISHLEALHYCFTIKPWSKNVSRSLVKEPKCYLWDWSAAPDIGSRNENFVASHLLKAVHGWTDAGLGDFGLSFLRTKDGREVDFLVTRDDAPWMMVEVKTSDTTMSRHLKYFYERLPCPHAFQAVIEQPYEGVNAFESNRPVVISAENLLSQLV